MKIKIRTLANKITQPHIYIGILTMLGAVMRFYHLAHKPLWLDEAMTYWIASEPTFLEIIRQNALQTAAPPLFVIVMSMIVNIGRSEFFLRLLPCLAGIASIPAIYQLARRFVSQYSSYMVAFFVAVAPYQIKYSQEFREYSLTFLMATLTILFFINFLRKPSKKSIIVLTVTMAISILLQYGLAILIISLNIIYLLRVLKHKEKKPQRHIQWVASQAIVFGIALLVIGSTLQHQMISGPGAHETSTYLSKAYWDGTITSLRNLLFINSLSLFLFAFPGGIFLFLSLSGLALTFYQKEKMSTLVFFLVPTVITLLLAMGRLYPYHGQRHCMFLMPMFFILAGQGIDKILAIRNEKVSVVLIAVCFIAFLYGLQLTKGYLHSPGDQYLLKDAVQTLSNSHQEDDLIYVYYGAKPAFTYYYPHQCESIVFGTRNRTNIHQYFHEIDMLIDTEQPVWFVFSHCVYEDECRDIVDYVANVRNLTILVQGTKSPYLVYAFP